MNADGSNQHRISFGEGRNGTPVWAGGDLMPTKQAAASILGHATGRHGERMLRTVGRTKVLHGADGRVLMFTEQSRWRGFRYGRST